MNIFNGARHTVELHRANSLAMGSGAIWNRISRIIATYSRRQGPISVPARVRAWSPLEFVETLGDLYSSAHAGFRCCAHRLSAAAISTYTPARPRSDALDADIAIAPEELWRGTNKKFPLRSLRRTRDSSRRSATRIRFSSYRKCSTTPAAWNCGAPKLGRNNPHEQSNGISEHVRANWVRRFVGQRESLDNSCS